MRAKITICVSAPMGVYPGHYGNGEYKQTSAYNIITQQYFVALAEIFSTGDPGTFWLTLHARARSSKVVHVQHVVGNGGPI